MWFHVQLCSVRMRLSAASSYAARRGKSDARKWSLASCASRTSVSPIQVPVLDTHLCVTTPVGDFRWLLACIAVFLWCTPVGLGPPPLPCWP